LRLHERPTDIEGGRKKLSNSKTNERGGGKGEGSKVLSWVRRRGTGALKKTKTSGKRCAEDIRASQPGPRRKPFTRVGGGKSADNPVKRGDLAVCTTQGRHARREKPGKGKDIEE